MKNNREVELVDIRKIRPYTNNPRLNAQSVAYLEEAIPRFGFTVPITVDENYVIVTGHSRHKAALNIGLEEVPVIVLRDLTPEQIREYRIADNKVQEFSELDLELKKDDLFNLTAGDTLMGSVFSDFVLEQKDINFEDEEEYPEEVQEEEDEAICICTACLEEFDAKKHIVEDEEQVADDSDNETESNK